MLHGFVQFARLVALFAAFGSLTWAVFGLISTSNEYGTHHPGNLGGPKTALVVFAAAAAVYVVLGVLIRGDR